MCTTIQKWGNSHAIRIPKAILEMAELNENDKVKIKGSKWQFGYCSD